MVCSVYTEEMESLSLVKMDSRVGVVMLCVVGTRTGCHTKIVHRSTTLQDSWECSEQIMKPKLMLEIWGRFQKSDRAQTNEKTTFITFDNKGPFMSSAAVSVECWTQKSDCSWLVNDQRVSGDESVETGWMLASRSLKVKGGL